MNTKIFEDNILSRNDIAVRYVFQKMFSPQGTLVAVECLSRFDNLSISPEDFFRHATAAVRERIFLEQLALIDPGATSWRPVCGRCPGPRMVSLRCKLSSVSMPFFPNSDAKVRFFC